MQGLLDRIRKLTEKDSTPKQTNDQSSASLEKEYFIDTVISYMGLNPKLPFSCRPQQKNSEKQQSESSFEQRKSVKQTVEVFRKKEDSQGKRKYAQMQKDDGSMVTRIQEQMNEVYWKYKGYSALEQQSTDTFRKEERCIEDLEQQVI